MGSKRRQPTRRTRRWRRKDKGNSLHDIISWADGDAAELDQVLLGLLGQAAAVDLLEAQLLRIFFIKRKIVLRPFFYFVNSTRWICRCPEMAGRKATKQL